MAKASRDHILINNTTKKRVPLTPFELRPGWTRDNDVEDPNNDHPIILGR
ncbi:hypothetical protein PVK06_048227 [Gossypium arboreum]|uniref:Uncharacterized protein n=1 Tax=Gossypium arboreum TaxID=29729 RepID=A0ABR0MFN2_GOSAR|nr:hypothetical protein PVK06_048227 [Gossypium arboreum]